MSGIRTIMIIEVMGRPKEHLIETLEGISKQIDDEPGVQVVEKKIKEPTLIKDQKDLFSSYMELEIETEEIMTVSSLMFKYMPAHVEIVEPENITMQNNDFTSLLNELTRRLHKYEEIARVIDAEKKILENQLKQAKEK